MRHAVEEEENIPLEQVTNFNEVSGFSPSSVLHTAFTFLSLKFRINSGIFSGL